MALSVALLFQVCSNGRVSFLESNIYVRSEDSRDIYWFVVFCV